MNQNMNPVHVQVALQEATTQLQLLSSRGQQLAVELFDARQTNVALSQELQDTKASNEAMARELQELRPKVLAPNSKDGA